MSATPRQPYSPTHNFSHFISHRSPLTKPRKQQGTDDRGSKMTNPPNEASPTISRSTTPKTTFTNLTPADSISRSTVENTTITRTPDASSISIKRSKLHSCALTNTSTRRCTLTNTTLVNIPAARSLDASNSSLSDIHRLRRSEIRASAVSDCSLSRSTVVDSTVKHTMLRRSKLDHVTLLQSRVKKAVLKNCEVRECVVTGTEFSGMRMRFGVWKNGRLVGRVGDGEVVFEEIGTKGKKVDAVADAKVEKLDYKVLQEESESEEDDEEESKSSASDGEAELPPPYAP